MPRTCQLSQLWMAFKHFAFLLEIKVLSSIEELWGFFVVPRCQSELNDYLSLSLRAATQHSGSCTRRIRFFFQRKKAQGYKVGSTDWFAIELAFSFDLMHPANQMQLQTSIILAKERCGRRWYSIEIPVGAAKTTKSSYTCNSESDGPVHSGIWRGFTRN